MCRLRPDNPVSLVCQDDKPVMLENGAVGYVIDSFRLWPNWWEGNPPRDYYLVQVGEKVMEMYCCEGKWFFSRYRG